jgi:hypothetical protein
VCGIGHGSSPLWAHWLSPWTDDSRERVCVLGLDWTVVDPQLLLINCAGELRMIFCGRKLSFVVRNWGL